MTKLIKDNLVIHPSLLEKPLSLFSQGYYDAAVFYAFKQVEVTVREAGGYAKTDYGTGLMRKAFNVNDGNLTAMDKPESEKEAEAHLFAAAIGAYKNPGSHHDLEITDEEAAEAIIFASLLLRIVDSRRRMGQLHTILRESEIDRQEETGDWQEQFADGFVHYLEDGGSPLMDPEVFMGKHAQGSLVYIGFNIGKIENLDMQDRNAFWLAASTAHSRKIYLKLHMSNPRYFHDLKSQEAEIEHEFGDQLKWESQGPGQYIRIGVDLEVDPLDENKDQWNQHFEKMRENLEKLDKTLLPYIEKIYSVTAKVEAFRETMALEERKEIGRKIAELRINPAGSKGWNSALMPWRKIREQLGIEHDDFHKKIRLEDHYEEACVERIESFKDGWEYYRKDLARHLGFEPEGELLERIDACKPQPARSL